MNLYASKSDSIAESYLLKIALNRTSDINIFVTVRYQIIFLFWTVSTRGFWSFYSNLDCKPISTKLAVVKAILSKSYKEEPS